MQITEPAGPVWERVTAPNCGWGASPFWHPQQDRLYWVDSAHERIWRLHLTSGHAEMWQLAQTPGSIAPCRSGALLMAMRSGILLCASWHNTPQQIAAAPYDPAQLRFHESQCDPWGRLWVGSRRDAGEQADGGLYCLHKRNRPSPELLRIAGGVVESGGLAWSPDGRTLYWGDSKSGRIDKYPLTSAGRYPPVLGPALGFAQFPLRQAGLDISGKPQGATIDSAGNYWVALADGACVLCLNPDGKLLARLPTPALRPTGLCFGGRDLRTLFLTTARTGLEPAELARHPDSGAVFALRAATPGRPVTPYED